MSGPRAAARRLRHARLQGEPVRHGDDARRRCAGDCEIVPFAAGADVYVVNSCTVTDRADAESRQLARRARRLNPTGRVILTGCFAQTSPQRAALPEVDYVIGVGRLPDILRAVHDQIPADEGRVLVSNLRKAEHGDDARRRGVQRPDARLPQGAGGLRSLLHLLHRAVRARPQPQRRAAPRARGARAAGGARLSRGRCSPASTSAATARISRRR